MQKKNYEFSSGLKAPITGKSIEENKEQVSVVPISQFPNSYVAASACFTAKNNEDYKIRQIWNNELSEYYYLLSLNSYQPKLCIYDSNLETIYEETFEVGMRIIDAELFYGCTMMVVIF